MPSAMFMLRRAGANATTIVIAILAQLLHRLSSLASFLVVQVLDVKSPTLGKLSDVVMADATVGLRAASHVHKTVPGLAVPH